MIAQKEIAVIEKESNQTLEEAKSMTVANQQQHDSAFAFLKNVKNLKKKVNETFDPIVKAAHASWKEAKAQQKKHLDPLDEAEGILKQACLEYNQEQERIQREEERKAREKAQAEEAKRRAELEAQAKNHEEKGRQDKADERRAQAEQVYIPPTPAVNRVEKAQGQIIRETWKGEVVNLKELCRAVAEGRAPLNLIQANITAINAQARASKDTMKIDGVRFYAEKSMAVR